MNKILIVDDDYDTRTALRSILEDDGYDVEVAINGKAAMELLQTCHCDLILLDLMMPIMNGFEVLEALQQIDALAKIPVVVASANPPARMESLCYFLRKPFDLDTLLDTVHTHCSV